MKTVAILVAGCALLATSALGETLTEKTGVNAVLGVAPKTQDFVQEAAISDKF